MPDTTRIFPVPIPSSPKWGEKKPRSFVDALAVSAWDEAYGQTLGYRWKGEDTLTWGNADEWILIKWLVQRFFAQEYLDISNFAQQEVNLWAVVSEMRIAKLETIFNFRNPDEVKSFLREHKLIIPVLLNTRSIVEEFFGNKIPVALEVVIDPEALNNKQLFGYISTGSMPQDEAFERFNAFDESWFLKQYDLTDGLFNFNLE
ncbi:MAG: hypothetical protein IMZ53_16530 [Thermoplasmata archaeon]|nr:hypothetical protein [Thermoplasmata archaeon]